MSPIFMLAGAETKCHGHGDFREEIVVCPQHGYFETEQEAQPAATRLHLQIIKIVPAKTIPLKFPTVPDRL